MKEQFTNWLSTHLKVSRRNINILLKDELATYFFMTWSIYESKCYNGFANINSLKKFISVIENKVSVGIIEEDAKYFHKRYQNQINYKHLIYDKKNDNIEFRIIISKEYSVLTLYEKLFLLSFVIYRYRNNIFHGNKGIESWLKYKEQIQKCITIMQLFLNITTYKNSNMEEYLKMHDELIDMIGVSITDSETCKKDIENLDNDFPQRYLTKLEYKELSEVEKDNIKNELILFRRRTYIKTIFSNIEGILYTTKQLILKNRDKITKDEELIKLQEKKYEGSSKDRLKEIIKRTGFLENMKLVFKYYKTFYSPDYSIDKFYTKLDQFKSVKDIRDKIVHPKDSLELNISIEELNKCKEFSEWFFSEFKKLLNFEE